MGSMINALFYKAQILLDEIWRAEGINLAKISVNCKVNPCYTFQIVNWCEQAGLITTKKQGKLRECFMTPKGIAVITKITEIKSLLKKGEENEKGGHRTHSERD